MKNILLITCITFMLLLTACDNHKGTIIAKVNEEVLTLEEFEKSFPSIEYNSMSAEKKREWINKWVELTLLAQKADQDDFLKDNNVMDFKIQNAVKKVKANAVINKELQSIMVSDEELFNYYRVHQGEFSKKYASYKVQRIFFNNQDDMLKVKNLLDNGSIKFTPAAIEYSQEDIGKYGGYMTESVTEKEPHTQLFNTLKSLVQYQYTTMPYNNGFIIVRYIESSEINQDASFEELKPEIEQAIIKEKRKDIYKNLIHDIKSESNIVISL